MVVFCLLAGSLLVFAAYGVVGHLDSRVRKHGPHALAWRWFSASGNWTGKAITNRGWTRPGTKALTPTGHAHRRWYLPRWQHALWRTEHTLAAVLLAFGLLLQPAPHRWTTWASRRPQGRRTARGGPGACCRTPVTAGTTSSRCTPVSPRWQASRPRTGPSRGSRCRGTAAARR